MRGVVLLFTDNCNAHRRNAARGPRALNQKTALRGLRDMTLPRSPLQVRTRHALAAG
jgi:hypothetical protein